MIGVLVPAHNEAGVIDPCLRSLQVAAVHPRLQGEPVRIVVALDACTDHTARRCAHRGVDVLHLHARCVGAARAAAAAYLLGQGAHWLASTDADSIVPAHWLAAQRSAGADAFCGVVDITAVDRAGARLQQRFRRNERWGDGHGRVHGANFGVSAGAYHAVGGFRDLPCGEDVDLVQRLDAAGARIRWAGAPAVLTSMRLRGRAQGGFADHLAALAAPLSLPCAAPAG